MLIRAKHNGVVKNHHSDGQFVQNNMQKIIRAMRIPFDKKKDVPLIHIQRKGYLGVTEISLNAFHPYELVDKSWVLVNEKYQEAMEICVRAQVHKTETRKNSLRDELDITMHSQILDYEKMREIVRWMIQNCPPIWILSALSLFFYGRATFFRVKHRMPYFRNIMDKEVGHISWVNIPFFKVPVGVFIELAVWSGCELKDYDYKIGPFVGELHLVSYLDSSYTLSTEHLFDLFYVVYLFCLFHIVLLVLYTVSLCLH